VINRLITMSKNRAKKTFLNFKKKNIFFPV
jgi:hypothetical protein